VPELISRCLRLAANPLIAPDGSRRGADFAESIWGALNLGADVWAMGLARHKTNPELLKNSLLGQFRGDLLTSTHPQLEGPFPTLAGYPVRGRRSGIEA